MHSPAVFLLRRCAWAAFAAATVWLAAALPTQPVDAQNRALKAPDSVDAQRLAALAEVVGDAPVVLVCFAAPTGLNLPDEQREAVRSLVQANATTAGVLAVTEAPVPDAGLAAFAVTVRHDDEVATAERLLANLRDRLPPGVTLHAAGLPLVEGRIAHLVAAERSRIVPLLLATLFAAAWFAYRRVLLAIAALAPALAAIAWTSGLLARLGHALDPVAALLDPVLLTIGVATSVHGIGAFLRAVPHHASPAAAADAAIAELKQPALLATATTMVGMWSLATSDIPAVLDFGLRSALGIGLAHAFVFLLLPPLLARVHPAAWSAPDAAAPATAWRWLQRHRASLLVGATAATTLAVAGLARVVADNDVLQLLPRDTVERQDHDLLAGRLGGVEAFHLLTPPRSAAAEPTRFLPFLAAIRELPGVAGLAGGALQGPDGEIAVPMALTPGGSAVREPLFAEIERMAAVRGFDGVAPAGPSVQLARDSARLLRSLLGSLGLSLALLALGMAAGLRSWRLAAIGIAPNLLPSIWLYGGLGWAGRPVSVATAMIGCTMIGLVVDNTIHLLHRYRALRSTLPRDAALRAAWLDCIRPMTLASAVLALGFGAAATSRLVTTAEFGVLAAATIATAWLGTAVLLPATLLRDARQESNA